MNEYNKIANSHNNKIKQIIETKLTEALKECNNEIEDIDVITSISLNPNTKDFVTCNTSIKIKLKDKNYHMKNAYNFKLNISEEDYDYNYNHCHPNERMY